MEEQTQSFHGRGRQKKKKVRVGKKFRSDVPTFFHPVSSLISSVWRSRRRWRNWFPLGDITFSFFFFLFNNKNIIGPRIQGDNLRLHLRTDEDEPSHHVNFPGHEYIFSQVDQWMEWMSYSTQHSHVLIYHFPKTNNNHRHPRTREISQGPHKLALEYCSLHCTAPYTRIESQSTLASDQSRSYFHSQVAARFQIHFIPIADTQNRVPAILVISSPPLVSIFIPVWNYQVERALQE